MCCAERIAHSATIASIAQKTKGGTQNAVPTLRFAMCDIRIEKG